jgi:hypothetical protein
VIYKKGFIFNMENFYPIYLRKQNIFNILHNKKAAFSSRRKIANYYILFAKYYILYIIY